MAPTLSISLWNLQTTENIPTPFDSISSGLRPIVQVPTTKSARDGAKNRPPPVCLCQHSCPQVIRSGVEGDGADKAGQGRTLG